MMVAAVYHPDMTTADGRSSSSRWITLADLRKSALRGVLVMAVAAALVATLAFVLGYGVPSLTITAATVLAPGLAVIPPSLVELNAARRAPFLRRDVLAGLIAFVGAILGLALAVVQVGFAAAMLEDGSFAAAIDRIVHAIDAPTDAIAITIELVAFAGPCALVCAGRLRGQYSDPTARALLWNLAGVSLAVLPLVFLATVAAVIAGGISGGLGMAIAGAIIMIACAVPGTSLALSYAFADAILGRRPTPQ